MCKTFLPSGSTTTAVADAFYQQKLIPQKIDIQAAILKPTTTHRHKTKNQDSFNESLQTFTLFSLGLFSLASQAVKKFQPMLIQQKVLLPLYNISALVTKSLL